MSVGPASQPDFLLRLYQAAREQPVGRFEETALEALRPLLGFDAAFWGSGRVAAGRVRLHAAHLHRLVMDHAGGSQTSIVNETLARRSGVRRSCHFARFRGNPAIPGAAADRVRTGRVAWEEALVLAHRLPDASVQWLTLYRRSADDGCRDTKSRRATRLAPHLFEARAINYALQSHRFVRGVHTSTGLAFCDRHGMPAHVDARFVELLDSEWSRWPGERLPTGLVELCRGGEGSMFMGTHIRVDARRAGDLVCLLARPRALADLLSPREREVVSHFVDGRSYKAIAKTLAVAPATVRNQLASAYGKLGAHNKIELRRIVDREPDSTQARGR